jgi:signal transduction histidine kinase/ActR/RegA family two-component response regulator
MWDRGPESSVILILAPMGRDGQVTCEILSAARLQGIACADFDELVSRVADGVGAILVAEEVLTAPHVSRLQSILERQPPWSDLPIIVFAAARVHHEGTERLRGLGNVIFLDRPVQRRSLLTAVRAALRSRDRQYEARRAIAGRDQFLAMLGHELRNPLSAILMAAELLGRRAGNADSGGKHVNLIERQARHLGRLVDDLLDVSRVTSGKVVLKREPVDLGSLVQRCAQSLELAARTQGLRLTVDVASALPMVDGDGVRLEQVVTNLLANSIKYTLKGGTIRAAVARDGGEIVLRIRDSGVGIAAEQLEAIFDVFVQAPTSLDRSRGGLGIGLSLVRALVEMHGGRVSATSPGPGQGSEFTIRLPAAKKTAPAAMNGGHEARPAAEIHRRIILVEDNGDIREMLEEALTACGHSVSTAADGPDGLSRLLSSPADVALVDIGLPGFDGYHLARQVRDSGGSQVFLIAMTGYGQPEDRRRAFEAGFDEHLTKPIDLDTLQRVLRSLDPARRQQPGRI